jgi:hypothetical protein
MPVSVVATAEPVAAGAALLAADRAGLLPAPARLPLTDPPRMPAGPREGIDRGLWDALFTRFNALALGKSPH